MKKLTYRRARVIVLILMIVGLAALIAAGYAAPVGSVLRYIFIWTGVILYLIALGLMWVAFRCPVCGWRHFKGGLFVGRCPACGADLSPYRDKPLGFRAPQRYGDGDGEEK